MKLRRLSLILYFVYLVVGSDRFVCIYACIADVNEPVITEDVLYVDFAAKRYPLYTVGDVEAVGTCFRIHAMRSFCTMSRAECV